MLLNDEEMLTRIQDVGFVAKEVHYHRICRSRYHRKSESALASDMKILGTNDDNRSSLHHSRDTHFEAFEVVCDFVEKSIIEKEEVHFMKDLNKFYHAALYDIGGPEFDSVCISSDKLAAKLTKTYGDRIKIEYGNARRGNIISSASKNPSGMLRKEVAEELKAHSKIRDAAFMLRSAIMEAPRERLPDDLQLKDILNGEVDVPDLVHHFFNYLIIGTDKRRGNVSAKRRRIEALCADTIFSTMAGNKKPAKHLKLGLTVKSMTGSRKLVEILNRYGYCVSYDTVEELETELTYEVQSKKLLTPYGMSLDPKLATGVAFDNMTNLLKLSVEKIHCMIPLVLLIR